MGKDLVIYKQLYKIIFKDKEQEEIIINEDMYKSISSDIKSNKWIEINNEIFGPFTIEKIVKFKMEDGVNHILNQESEEIQKEVKRYIKTYKKDVTIGVMQNMIKKAKELV